MNKLVLQPNVQFLYEEQLAHIEMAALGCEFHERSAEDPRNVTCSVNGTSADVVRRAAYVGELDGANTVYGELIRPKYQGGQFNRTRSVNQYLTHWFYPYRGKFHPQMVRALLNTVGCHAGFTVLDPYVGSGTTALESSLLGVRCVGIDLSPLCILLTRVKVESHKSAEDIAEVVEVLLRRSHLDPMDASVPMEYSGRVGDFLEIARMVSVSDIARRKRDGDTCFRRNLTAMRESVLAHAEAISEFGIEPGAVTAQIGDARSIPYETGSIDAVVTSPPYSLALDYVQNDEHALLAMGADVECLRKEMTGVRGRGAKRLELYELDMKQMFCEVARVLKPGAQAVFVIGDATVDGKEYTTTVTMGEWAHEAGLVKERQMSKIVYGLYNVMNHEKILWFRKQ